MSRRVLMVLSHWKPARKGDSFDQINDAWNMIHALIEAAIEEDRKERS